MRLIALSFASFILCAACGKTTPPTVDGVVAVAAAEDAAVAVEPEAPPLTPEERLAKHIHDRENAPEPVLNPDEPREQFQLVWIKGKETLRSAQEARYNLFLQMKAQKLTEKEHAELFEKKLKEIEGFGIGQSVPELEEAAGEICTVVKSLRDGAKVLTDAPTAELATLDAEIAVLEKEQADGKTVSQRKWDKIEDQRKELSKPILGGRFLLLAARQIIDEGVILAEWAPRRAQIELRDCAAGIIAEGGLPLDLAQASLEKLLARAKWYRELE